jgi:CMP-N-acetylneuraminic acid synthetase
MNGRRSRKRKIVAVIAARGGSKAIPNKNIKSFCGKPLIAWTIESALASEVANRVLVTTDDLKIRRVALRYGAESPFLRPKRLAAAKMGLEPVLLHAYEWLRDQEQYRADVLLLLPATNPLRRPFHIREAVELFFRKKAHSVVAVHETPANYTPYWTLVRSESGEVTLFSGKSLKTMYTQRQDFPLQCYTRNDLIYVLRPENLYQKPSNLYGDRVELYVTSSTYDGDINDENDWNLTEVRFRQQRFAKAP